MVVIAGGLWLFCPVILIAYISYKKHTLVVIKNWHSLHDLDKH